MSSKKIRHVGNFLVEGKFEPSSNLSLNQLPHSSPSELLPQSPTDQQPRSPIDWLPHSPPELSVRSPIDELSQSPIDKLPRYPIDQLPQSPIGWSLKSPIELSVQLPIDELPQSNTDQLPQSSTNQLSQSSTDLLLQSPPKLLLQSHTDQLLNSPLNQSPHSTLDPLPQSPVDNKPLQNQINVARGCGSWGWNEHDYALTYEQYEEPSFDPTWCWAAGWGEGDGDCCCGSFCPVKATETKEIVPNDAAENTDEPLRAKRSLSPNDDRTSVKRSANAVVSTGLLLDGPLQKAVETSTGQGDGTGGDDDPFAWLYEVQPFFVRDHTARDSPRRVVAEDYPSNGENDARLDRLVL